MSREIDTLELDLDGWDAVVTEEHNVSEEVAAKVEDAETNQDESDGSDQESIPNDGPDVFERVSRFEASKKIGQEDPHWLGKFFEITEEITDIYKSPSNLQGSLNLLSGCSGLLAEGWVCKAGICPVRHTLPMPCHKTPVTN